MVFVLKAWSALAGEGQGGPPLRRWDLFYMACSPRARIESPRVYLCPTPEVMGDEALSVLALSAYYTPRAGTLVHEVVLEDGSVTEPTPNGVEGTQITSAGFWRSQDH